ncbi:aminotransferase class V-fold PLP-dependent enzyme [Microbacterium sp. TNHR37B]|uniref:aminotransferase class V-fold PLP-dependent enzyme n=1 Tax=Microbacterium sp. TNHR37B TaxID=1775956 RepID=UPI0007B1A3B5|nr:aminotransferase class V-fold PLP-dependent enzyme [Microbacterium sp. TNHR37B]KZE90236.1 putative cysteine desulfurase [Microbacterium sp. TNHR37B]
MAATDPLRLLLRHRRGEDAAATGRSSFAYLSDDDIYLDSACQTLRPQPVIDALTSYFTTHNACGDRVKYAWGKRVEEGVAATRQRVLTTLGLPSRRYTCSFTLNTTYGLNLLLQQLPTGRFARVVTTHTEHNAVHLSTITAAHRLGIPRVLAERGLDGSVLVADADLADAVVVVSAMDNVVGQVTGHLEDLITDAHRRGAIVILDAAQAAPHALTRLRGVGADAICFSAHKMYGPALGVVAAANDLLASLEVVFVGGGQVAAAREDDFDLLPDLHTRLEPGLQAWGEILAFGAALEWLRPRLAEIEAAEARFAERLFDGLSALPHLRVLNAGPSPVISAVPERVDAHRLAVFLSRAGVMVRSGHFCAHHWLQERLSLDPLVRFSLGAHNTDHDVERALEVMTGMMRGL